MHRKAVNSITARATVRQLLGYDELTRSGKRRMVQLGAVAIPPLLEIITGEDTRDTWAVHHAIEILCALGAPALEPALAALAAHDDEAVRRSLLEVLAGIRVPDPRVLALLIADLDQDLLSAAWNLGIHGDPAALPHLRAALDACLPPDSIDPTDDDEAGALGLAIQELGGVLTPEQQAKSGVFEPISAVATHPRARAAG